jgi:hypothetical protein
MGDFGSATEAVRIIDLFAFQVFAKIWTAATFEFCNTIRLRADIRTTYRCVRLGPQQFACRCQLERARPSPEQLPAAMAFEQLDLMAAPRRNCRAGNSIQRAVASETSARTRIVAADSHHPGITDSGAPPAITVAIRKALN